jgi:hypothetical protein
MSVYTVHEPRSRFADAPLEPERFVFVRDRFSIWAFLFAPLWMLWHRMWLVLLGYIVLSAGLEALAAALGASGFVVGLIGLFISLLVGFEAATLRRLALARRGWKNVGVVSGDDREAAERRYFDAWVREVASRAAAATPAPSAPAGPMASATIPPAPPTPRGPDVIGLFPEPGAQR